MTTAISVRSYSRSHRRDRIGELLAAASSLQNPRTVRDWCIEFSRKNDDDQLPLVDRWLLHLDPVELRSAVTQAQQRLHQACDARILTDKATGQDIEVEKAVTAGTYAHLLGKKLFPSVKPSKPGKKEARWCGDVQPIEDSGKETVPDGMSYPPIVELKNLAAAAGDNDLNALKAIATMPARARRVAIDEQKRHYLTIIRARGEVTELRNTVERKEQRILELTSEVTGLRQEVEALQDLRTTIAGLDMDRLKSAFGRKPGDSGDAMAAN